jgi:transposase-like protein
VRFLRATRQVVITIAGKRHWLWRAVDQEGFVLDVLVQSRRSKKAAKRLFRKLLKKQGRRRKFLRSTTLSGSKYKYKNKAAGLPY